tara:strand:- start:428 stop:709 length:282 start_codon:yes stop_codon:yes gene_type:complete
MVERQEVRMLAQVTAMRVRFPHAEKTKVSLAMIISQGLVGPKRMAKAGRDGQTVNIPSLDINAMGGRSAVCLAYYWIYVHYIGVGFWKIRDLA